MRKCHWCEEKTANKPETILNGLFQKIKASFCDNCRKVNGFEYGCKRIEAMTYESKAAKKNTEIITNRPKEKDKRPTTMKWKKINSKKDLPPICEDVLFIDEGKIYLGWLESGNPSSAEEPRWYNNNKAWAENIAKLWSKNITYWMPLPKLPKQDS
jgi:hypothetical protein